MVYESDFYTTRRPYRPSSYSVTQSYPVGYATYVSPIPKVHTVTTYYPHHVSRLAPLPHTRLLTSPSPPHHVVTVRVRPAVILRELDRIANRHRRDTSYSPTEDYLSSASSQRWEDETRRIKADAASVLRRIHSSPPRALLPSVLPISTLSTYSEPILPIRITSDDYINRLLLPLRNVAHNIQNISWYAEPAKKFTGRGHLACIRYSGQKAFPNRRSLYSDLTVKDDVNLLSFYVKNRLAAAGLAAEAITVKLLPWRASRKFQKPGLMEDPALELKAAKAERLERFNAVDSQRGALPPSEADAIADRKKKRQEEAQLAEERALLEESARKKEEAKRAEEARANELARQELLAAQAAAERAAEMERKEELARQAELEAEEAKQASKLAEEAKLAEQERLAAEAKLAELARIAEEARQAEAKKAEEERIAAEQEETRQRELARLEELEIQAAEEREAELARQAAELAELARQESELAALAKQEAELAELAKQEAELAELAKQEAELAELERQEAELAALDAEAKALEESANTGKESEEDLPIETENNEEQEPEPTVEEPETPEVETQEQDAEPYVSDAENAEGDITGDEEE